MPRKVSCGSPRLFSVCKVNVDFRHSLGCILLTVLGKFILDSADALHCEDGPAAGGPKNDI